MADESLLARVYIASPCNAKWNDMQGDERERLCMQCTKKVYNVSEMRKGEAEAILAKLGTNACMRIYRRRDGTIMTDDCPVGLRKIRNAVRWVVRIAATVMAFAVSTSFAFAKPNHGKPAGKPQVQADPLDSNPVTSGDIKKNSFLSYQMGEATARKAEEHEQHLPPLAELTSGRYALTDAEIYEEHASIFLRHGDVSVSQHAEKLEADTGVDELPKTLKVQDVFERAKHYEKKSKFKTAELYYKLAMHYLDYFALTYQHTVQNDIVRHYAQFLRDRARYDEAKLLQSQYLLTKSESDTVTYVGQ